MTTVSFISAGPSAPAGFLVPADVPTPANPLMPASLVSSFHAGLLIIKDITKLLFMKKPVTAIDNTTA